MRLFAGPSGVSVQAKGRKRQREIRLDAGGLPATAGEHLLDAA
jgi:hypothetical protein